MRLPISPPGHKNIIRFSKVTLTRVSVNMINMVKNTFLESFKFLISFLKTDWIYFLSFTLFVEIMQHYVIIFNDENIENTSVKILTASTSFLLGIFVSIYYYFIIPLRAQQNAGLESKIMSFWVYSIKSTIPLAIESLRVLARLLLWVSLVIIPLAALAFIEQGHWLNNALLVFIFLCLIPASYKYCTYVFVPFIVITHPLYKKAGIDALAKSIEMTKGRRIFIFIIMLIISAAQLVNAHLQNQSSSPDALSLTVPLQALCIFLSFFFTIVLFQIYRLKMSEHT